MNSFIFVRVEMPYCIYYLTLNLQIMTKAELVSTIAEEAGITKAQAADALSAVTGAIQQALSKGDKVTLVGFGTWSVSKRAARMGKNPRTGEPIKIAAKNVVKFKAGATLGNSVN